MILIFPCQLPFLGSAILPRNQCDTPIHAAGMYFAGVRILLAIFEMKQLLYMILSGGFYSIYTLMAGTIHLWIELKKICEDNTVKFSKRYRQVQVFEQLLNSCTRFRIFPVFAATVPGIQIITTYACVKHFDAMQLTHLLVVFFGMVDGILFNMVLFTGSAKLYSKSADYLDGVRIRARGKLETRFARSLTQVRLRFGNNFVDELTPLVVQHFCSIQIVNLLLLG
ncbi:uncharacterized protein LOC110850231 [Folsomia candida]|uniref:uncharacterized protein LOC110850231 n=1 Tax=Folsomia candida TaxID=158441 RepID=UPI001604F3FD|nr:uncharacterized protein LOC110850231 [Folsomia candida]